MMHGAVAIWIEKCKAAINKEGNYMCKCGPVSRFQIKGKIFQARYVCGTEALVIDLLDKNGDKQSQVDYINIGGFLEADKTERDELNDIIQGLDDKEVERLMGYLEGWRDSDDE